MSAPFQLTPDAFGKWTLTLADGTVYPHVVVVRAFPIAAADEGISVLSVDGKEVHWIAHLSALEDAQRDAVCREFMPEIQRLDGVNSFSTPSVWRVQTNRGPTEFILKGEEDIRRLSVHTLIVSDAHGVQYLIRHLPSLDRHTRKLLDRFL